MDWHEITIKTDNKNLERASAIAQMISNLGLYIEDYSTLLEDTENNPTINYIENDLLAKDKTKAIIHVYLNVFENLQQVIESLEGLLVASNIEYELDVLNIKEEDWENNWKKYYKPFSVGDKIIIKPEWEEIDNTSNRKILNISPGMAFGTGTHESTRMCLLLLEKFIKDNDSVLDVGCGSGILSIAALLLNAEFADAVDIDPVCVETATKNGQLNGYTKPKYNVIKGDLLNNIQKKYNIVCANIVADVIKSICPSISNYLENGGVFISSGIIRQKHQEVLDALYSAGFKVIDCLTENEWVAIAAVWEPNHA